jgi:urease accessory protein
VGGLFGGFGGSLPGAEVLAALGVAALGTALFLSLRGTGSRSLVTLTSAAAVGVHAMLHGLEASGTAYWWLGSLLSSAAVVAASAWICQRLNRQLALAAAAVLAAAGALLALAPL